MSITPAQITTLPSAPGVYLFRDASGEVLYVGKATSLKNRVRQYFSGQEEKSRGQRMTLLVTQTEKIDIIETESALEALILEAELIKKHQPKYNVDGKDDKSYSYFVITKETFPRVLIVRETDFDKKQFRVPAIARGRRFGPYTSTGQMRIALRIIRKIFPFHNRSEHSEKGCLSYQIGLCPGPYDGAISVQEYKRNMRNISLFLTGHKKQILAGLKKEMNAYAQKEQFEAANVCKKQMYALTHINDIALLTREQKHYDEDKGVRIECYDISHIGGQDMVASMVVAIDGRLQKRFYRKFKVKAVEGIDDVAAMREVLARRLRHFTDWGTPDVIILDGGRGHLNMGEKLFCDMQVPHTVGLLGVAKGPTRKKVDVYESADFPVMSNIVQDTYLLELLREEAHRFAITYHKQLRDKHFLA